MSEVDFQTCFETLWIFGLQRTWTNLPWTAESRAPHTSEFCCLGVFTLASYPKFNRSGGWEISTIQMLKHLGMLDRGLHSTVIETAFGRQWQGGCLDKRIVRKPVRAGVGAGASERGEKR